MVDVTLRAWSHADRLLLARGNTPAMTAHLGGPETEDEVTARHNNYLRYWRDGTARMFAVKAYGVTAGAIGWWSTRWRDEDVHETGWFVVPEMQGLGIARAAVALVVEDARRHGAHPLLTAFPSVTNVASNALCASTGFTWRGTDTVTFRGTTLHVNAWAVELAG